MEKTLWILALVLVALGSCERKKATCNVIENEGESGLTDHVIGTVDFEQEDSDEAVEVHISLSGFNTTDGRTLHGFHVHTEGDITGGCSAAGGHYNPDSNPHGAQTDANSSRHAGDLGNIEEDSNGDVEATLTDSYISLQGQYNIIGRAIVVHMNEDTLDESVDTSGGAGTRISCCVITEEDVDGAAATGVSLTTLLMALLVASYTAFT